MEITYHWEGDYLIPDLKLSDTTDYHIGRYGRMRQKYLKENHRGVYSYEADIIDQHQLLAIGIGYDIYISVFNHFFCLLFSSPSICRR